MYYYVCVIHALTMATYEKYMYDQNYYNGLKPSSLILTWILFVSGDGNCLAVKDMMDSTVVSR